MMNERRYATGAVNTPTPTCRAHEPGRWRALRSMVQTDSNLAVIRHSRSSIDRRKWANYGRIGPESQRLRRCPEPS